jgi:predicted permease
MNFLHRLLLLLPGRRRACEHDLQEELEANLALAIRDAVDSGMSREDAERAARRDFGNLTRAREESRGVWLPGWDAVTGDFRYAWRSLWHNPTFSLVAVLSLALGTGAATALFSVVNAVLLKPLAYERPGQLLLIREIVGPLAHIYPTMPVNYQHFRTWREHAKSFDGMAAITSATVTMDTGADVETIGMARVSANLFHLLGARPQLGWVFESREDQPGHGNSVVITDGYWRRRFGAAATVVGRIVRIGDQAKTIVGVLPPDFRFPKKNELGELAVLPEQTEVFGTIQQFSDGWGGDYDFIVIGRLRHGMTREQAGAELDVITSGIVAGHGLRYDLRTRVLPVQDVIGSPVRTSLTVLLAAVLVLVLIVCVNLANLLLARGTARARELSMRVALGATRGRLLTAALAETLLLSCAGGGLGIAAAHLALGVFRRSTSIDLPRIDEVAIDPAVLAFALGLSLICAALFGAMPALRLSRADVQTALRDGSASVSGSRRGLRLREWLVGAEVTLGTLLVCLATLLAASLSQVLNAEKGFTATQSLDVRLQLPSHYKPENRAAFFDNAVERLRGLPGIHAAAAASRVPLAGESNVNNVRLNGADSMAFDASTAQAVMVNIRFIGPDYFAALGIPVLQGRAVEPADRDRSVAVVSRRLAEKLWPGQNPLGKRIAASGSHVRDADVVGVVADVHSTRLDTNPTLMIYVPFWRYPNQVRGLVVRTDGDAAAAMQAVRHAIRQLDPGIPDPKMQTMENLVAESVSRRRLQVRVALAFATAALFLSAIGIYGVVAYGAALRRREMAIRMALGAHRSQIGLLTVWQGLRPAVIGAAAGIVLALAADRWIQSLLYGVSVADTLILASVAVGLATVAGIASLLPAYTATRADPAPLLRAE